MSVYHLAYIIGQSFVPSLVAFLVIYTLIKITSKLSFNTNKKVLTFLLTWAISVGFYFILIPMTHEIFQFYELVASGVAALVSIAIVRIYSKNINDVERDAKLLVKDNELYETALNELENQTFDIGLWAKAISLSDGDDLKAKAEFIKLRTSELSKKKASSKNIRSFFIALIVVLIMVLVLSI